MTPSRRFPHTPHLAWLGTTKPREDKVLTPIEAERLLGGVVVVEEKVDGANLGFSVSANSELFAQNRGSFLGLDRLGGQWRTLGRWLAPRRAGLLDTLSPNLTLFGEWCYAVHSLRYTRLPDWFLAFDVYDSDRDEFWSVERRNDLVRTLDMQVVPRRGAGHFTLDAITRLLSTSDLSNGPAEGVYVRREHAGVLHARAKLVHPKFVQSIDRHWAKRAIETNKLAAETLAARDWR